MYSVGVIVIEHNSRLKYNNAAVNDVDFVFRRPTEPFLILICCTRFVFNEFIFRRVHRAWFGSTRRRLLFTVDAKELARW